MRKRHFPFAHFFCDSQYFEMDYFKFIIYSTFILFTCIGCSTSKSVNYEKTSLQKSRIADNLSLGILDSATQVALDLLVENKQENVSSPTSEGRKIIYRDLSALKNRTLVSGKISTKTCINRDGIVTYVHIIKDETTITRKDILENYLRYVAGYRFDPKPDAPVIQCGKMSFNIDNSINSSLRR